MNRESVLTYINILSDSTKKKENILIELIKIAKRQEEVAKAPSFEMEEFTSLMHEKEKWIQALSTIEDGFGQTFNRIKDSIILEKELYKEEIIALQSVIDRVTEKAVALQTLEIRNKALVERRILEGKQKVRTIQVSNKAAGSYYKNMPNRHYNQSYFMDKKR